jgi:hypothetical protein
MALLDKITRLFQKDEPPKIRLGELASSESKLSYKNGIIPYNPDTLISRKGMQIYDQMRIDDMVKSSLSLKNLQPLHLILKLYQHLHKNVMRKLLIS